MSLSMKMNRIWGWRARRRQKHSLVFVCGMYNRVFLRQYTYFASESLCSFLKLINFVLEVRGTFGQEHEDVGLDVSAKDFRGSL